MSVPAIPGANELVDALLEVAIHEGRVSPCFAQVCKARIEVIADLLTLEAHKVWRFLAEDRLVYDDDVCPLLPELGVLRLQVCELSVAVNVITRDVWSEEGSISRTQSEVCGLPCDGSMCLQILNAVDDQLVARP